MNSYFSPGHKTSRNWSKPRKLCTFIFNLKIGFTTRWHLLATSDYLDYVKSHEVTENLQELKDSIALSSDIRFEDKCQLIDKMNSFNGFDANGYFTLGKQHLTSIMSNFATFIIVLIQFKMSEKTEN